MDRDQEIERDVADTSTEHSALETDRSFDRPGDRASSVRDDIRSAIRETEDNTYERKPYDAVEEPREAKPKAERKARRTREELDRDMEAANAAFDGQQDAGEADTGDAEPVAREAEQGSQEAPASWTKEAKKEWAKAPARIKQEVLKREADIQKGVQQLQARYGEIDAAIAPYHEAIKQFNKTPGAAVAQLFGWFQALAADPDRALPALMASYRYNPEKLVRTYLQNRGIDPNILNNARLNPALQYNQRLQALEQATMAQQQHFQQQQQAYQQQQQAIAQQRQAEQLANTETMLNSWAESKPHFEKVRVLMGHLLTPVPNTGQAPVPLKRDGTIDLETAYRWAVRAQLGDRAAADRDYASSARRKTSLSGSAPGYSNGRADRGPPRGVSVRDSIKNAIAEASNR